MPINNGEIICPNCGEKFDRQFIKDLINSEEKIISGTIGAKERIKEIVDELKKVDKQGKEISKLYGTLVSLELLLCEVNDIKLAKLKRIGSIIGDNLLKPFKLEKQGEDTNYEINYTINDERSKKGKLRLRYDGDSLEADVEIEDIGGKSFTIKDHRVIEVLHFIDSIYYKKDSRK